MLGTKSSKAALIATAVALAGLALPTTAASADPPGHSQAGGNGKDTKSTGGDYNNGKKLKISKKDSEKVIGQAPKGPAKVGKSQTWLALDDYQGSIYLKNYTLRGVGEHIEVWVANNLSFPGNDCRNSLVPSVTQVTDAQVQSFITEFDTNMYPKESEAFSVAPDRNGHKALLPTLIPSLPSSAYKGEGDNTVVLVDNVRDANFYDPATPDGQTYIAGFFYSLFNEYFNRNVMTIDSFDWVHRTGANPSDNSADPAYVACGTAIGRQFGAPRPRLYEGIFAHEYQHLLEYYEDPGELSWVNEGLSDWAQTLVGYVDPTLPPDAANADSHMACFQGFLGDNFGGPENSLTLWGDQGGPEILCDYGAAYLFMQYLESLYGEAFLTELHRNDLHGLEGLQAVLDQFGAGVTAQETIHNWAAMVALDGALDANGGVLNGGDAAALSASSLTTKINWDTVEAYGDAGAPVNGSDYVRLRDGGGGYLSAGDLSSIEFSGSAALDPDPVEWVVDATPPDSVAGASCGTPPAAGSGAPALYSGCGPNLDRAIVTPVSVPSGGGNLTFDALWDTEVGWDFAFVQVSTDGGATWTSLATADTTSDHDPGAIPAVVANLPGFDGESNGWTSESADLSAYDGQDVLLAFRYITDGGVDEAGFWVRNIDVAGTPAPSDDLSAWQSLTQVNPVSVPGWTVQLVAYGPDGSPAWIHRMAIDGSFSGSLSGTALADAVGGSATTVAALVMVDDPTEFVTGQPTYTLTVNGVVQPGGS